MDKIIIEVRGGIVQAVYSMNKNLKRIAVLDWDNVDIINLTSDQKELLNELKGMEEIL